MAEKNNNKENKAGENITMKDISGAIVGIGMLLLVGYCSFGKGDKDPNEEAYKQCPDCKPAGNACLQAVRNANRWSVQNLVIRSWHWDKETHELIGVVIEGDFQNPFGAWEHKQEICIPRKLNDGSWKGFAGNRPDFARGF